MIKRKKTFSDFRIKPEKKTEKKIGRPEKSKKEKLQRIYASLLPRDIETLEKIAANRDEPVGIMIRKIFLNFIRENQ